MTFIWLCQLCLKRVNSRKSGGTCKLLQGAWPVAPWPSYAQQGSWARHGWRKCLSEWCRSGKTSVPWLICEGFSRCVFLKIPHDSICCIGYEWLWSILTIYIYTCNAHDLPCHLLRASNTEKCSGSGERWHTSKPRWKVSIDRGLQKSQDTLREQRVHW